MKKGKSKIIKGEKSAYLKNSSTYYITAALSIGSREHLKVVNFFPVYAPGGNGRLSNEDLLACHVILKHGMLL
jgi:hypothetical protein